MTGKNVCNPTCNIMQNLLISCVLPVNSINNQFANVNALLRKNIQDVF